MEKRFFGVVVVIRKTICELLKVLSVDHPDSKSNDGNKALAEIINCNKKISKIPSFVNAQDKLFDKKTGAIRTEIDIDSLEIQQAVNLLLRIKGFPTCLKNGSKVSCTGIQHQGKCCLNCNHNYKKSSRKCCNFNQEDCKNNSKICCRTCKMCSWCIRNETPDSQCKLYILRLALKQAVDLRNCMAHSTNEYTKFETGNYRFKGFENHSNWDALSKYIKEFVQKNVLDYLQNPTNFTKATSLKNYNYLIEEFKQVCNDLSIDEIMQKYSSNLQMLIDAQSDKLNKMKDTDDVKDEIKFLNFERISPADCVIRSHLEDVTDVKLVLPEGHLKEVEWRKQIKGHHSCYIHVQKPFTKGILKFRMTSSDGNINDTEEIDFDDIQCSHTCEIDTSVLISHSNGLQDNFKSALLRIKSKSPLEDSKPLILPVFGGASNKSQIKTIGEWFQICKDYFERNFGSMKEVVKLPVTGDHDDMVNEIAASFQNLLKKGFIISSYDSRKCCNFLQINLEAYSRDTKISPDVDFRKRILVYDPKEHILLNIRVADKAGEVSCTLSACSQDVILLAVTHADAIFQSGVLLVGIIVVPDDYESMNENNLICSTCKDYLIVSIKELDRIKSWWKEFLKILGKESERRSLSVPEKRKGITTLLSPIIGFMATENVYMPSLSDNISKQLKTVMLTGEQQKVVECKENKIIIIGPFGSGKSVVGQLKLRRLAECERKPSMMYYLCDDDETLFNLQMMQFVKTISKNRNVQIVVNNLSRLQKHQDEGISKTIENIFAEHQDVLVHITIEEFNGERLSETEATKIKQFLHKSLHPYMEESTIVLIGHSMEKNREFIKGDEKNTDVSVKHDKYKYEMTGMKIFELSQSVRNTVSVIKVLKKWRSKVTEMPNVFWHPSQHIENGYQQDDTLLSDNNEASVSEAVNTGPASEALFSQTSTVALNADNESEADISSDPELLNKRDDPMSDSELLVDITEDTDIQMSIVNSEEYDSEAGKTVTTFRFRGKLIPGHSINGNLPKIFDVVLETYEIKALEYYSVCFKSLWKYIEMPKTSTLLCLNKKTCTILRYMMKLLKKDYHVYTPALNRSHVTSRDKVLYDYANGSYLVTDFKGFRGMESENLVVMVSHDDHCLRQYLVECLSRCMGTPVIFYINQSLEDNVYDQPAVHDMLTDLCDGKLMERKQIFCCTQEDCEKDCIIDDETGEHSCSYTFHMHTERVSQLLTKLKDAEFDEISINKRLVEESLQRKLVDPYLLNTQGSDGVDPDAAVQIGDVIGDPIGGLSNLNLNNSAVAERKAELEVDTMERKEIDASNSISDTIQIPVAILKDLSIRGYFRLNVIQERFRVKMILHDNVVEIRGRNNDVNEVKQLLKEYVNYKPEGVVNDPVRFEQHIYGDYLSKSWDFDWPCWSGIDFISKTMIGALIGKGGSNIRKLREYYNVKIVWDEYIEKVLVKGERIKKNLIKSYLRLFLAEERGERSSPTVRKFIFVLGLRPDTMMSLAKNPACNHCSDKLCEIVSVNSNEEQYDNHLELNGVIKELLEHLQSLLIQSEDSTCDIIIHHGKIHHYREPGNFSVRDIQNQKRMEFGRYSWDDFGFRIFDSQVPTQTVFEFDFRILTPYPEVLVRYKVFLERKSEQISFISCEEAGITRKRYYQRVGPGYFYSSENAVSSLDVLDPFTNMSTRFKFKIFNSDQKTIQLLNFHLETLKYPLENIQIINKELVELKMEGMPEGYQITFARRSERTSYRIGTQTTARTSRECIFVQAGLPCDSVIHDDIFLSCDAVSDREWKIDDVLTGFKETLSFSEYLKSFMR